MSDGTESSKRVTDAAPPAPGSALRVVVDGTAIAVFNLDGKLFAVDSKCTHVGGPLEQGKVSGHTVSCPWHGSVFDLETGKVERGPATRPVVAYHVTVEANMLVLQKRTA